MNDKKKSFLLLLEYQDVIETLSDEEAGQLIKAIYKYESTGESIELSPVVKIAFIPIKNKLDENRKKYEAKCELNKTNGSKGGRPKEETQGNPEKPKETQNNQTVIEETETNQTVIIETQGNPEKPDNDLNDLNDFDLNDLNDFDLNDFDNESDNTLKPPLSPFTDFAPVMQEKLDEWLQYKKERKEAYKPTGLKSFISQVKNKLAIYTEKSVIELIDECMSNQYKGIIWDKLSDGMKRGKTSGQDLVDMINGGAFDE